MSDELQPGEPLNSENTPEKKAAKKKAPSKADLQAELAALKAQMADTANTPADEGNTVMVQCVCDNVHINTGEANQILRATRPNPNANFSGGDTAMVSPGMANLLVEKNQCIIV